MLCAVIFCSLLLAKLDAIREVPQCESFAIAGLGLAIVKRIMELHHSRIRVESEADRGTAFLSCCRYGSLDTGLVAIRPTLSNIASRCRIPVFSTT